MITHSSVLTLASYTRITLVTCVIVVAMLYSPDKLRSLNTLCHSVCI